MRLHVLYAEDAPSTSPPLLGQGAGLGQGGTDMGQGLGPGQGLVQGLGQGVIRSVDGWVSVAGRIPEVDVAPILEVGIYNMGG